VKYSYYISCQLQSLHKWAPRKCTFRLRDGPDYQAVPPDPRRAGRSILGVSLPLRLSYRSADRAFPIPCLTAPKKLGQAGDRAAIGGFKGSNSVRQTVLNPKIISEKWAKPFLF
jgi:hypothetical protein